MTTTIPQFPNLAQNGERVAEFHQQAVANGRKAGAEFVTAWETAALSAADAYEQAADAIRVDWLSGIVVAQARLGRDVTKATVGAARNFVA